MATPWPRWDLRREPRADRFLLHQREEALMKRMAFAAALVAVTGLMTLTASLAAASTPLWVKHVNRYPGGISNGVRAYTDPGLQRAQASARLSGASSSPAAPAVSGNLQNIQVNQDSSPP